jgi:hypothetical protein
MRPLPDWLSETDRRFVWRVSQQPYLRFETNDSSLDPRLANRRVEVRVSQRELGQSRSTPASWPVVTAAPSPSTSPSPTPTSNRSSSA